MGVMTSQITSNWGVCLATCSGLKLIKTNFGYLSFVCRRGGGGGCGGGVLVGAGV